MAKKNRARRLNRPATLSTSASTELAAEKNWPICCMEKREDDPAQSPESPPAPSEGLTEDR